MVRLIFVSLVFPFLLFGKDYSPNELLITLSDKTNPYEALDSLGVKQYESLELLMPSDKGFFQRPLVVRFDDSVEVEAKLQELLKSPLINQAQFNYLYSIQLEGPPNDPLFEKQWEQKNESIQMLWKESTDCNQKIVAVLDTGVNFLHPDLKESEYSKNFNVLNPFEKPQDFHGHGTLMASIIGAKGNNQSGVTGVCWSTKIMAIKVLNDLGDGFSSDIIKGLTYALKNGASILNLSFGTYAGEDIFLKNALKKSVSQGAIAVVPAGNQGIDTDKTPFWPCSYKLKGVLCVAASDEQGKLATFSNFGAVGIDLASPGENILGIAAGLFKDISDLFEKDWQLGESFEVLYGDNCYQKDKNVLAHPLNSCEIDGKGLAPQEAFKNFGEILSQFDSAYVNFLAKIKGEVFFTINQKSVQKIPSGQTDFFLDLSPCRGKNNCILGFSTDDKDAKFGIWDFKIWGLKLGDSTYQKKFGTSLAAAYVSGLAALIGTYNPKYRGKEIIDSLKYGAKKSPLLEGKINKGRIIDPFGHLQYLATPKWK